MRNSIWRLALGAGVGGGLCVPVPVMAAAPAPIEEVVVTGSYIRGTPEDAASPVDVRTRQDFELSGNPSLVELIKRLGPVSGVDGETNQFQSNGLEAVSNVNLRGLGPGRTLVLLNGARMVPTPFPVPETGQQFVNTNAIPDIAIERIELLKDGASATYGSDAIAGVANFITRSDFRGIEFQGAFKGLDDGEDEGDWDAGIIAGAGTDRLDLVASFAYQFRSEVPVRDKDWALQPITENPRGGFSSIGSPGTYIPITEDDPASLTDGEFVPEPACEAVGGHLATLCQFRFTDFDNLAEEEEHWQVFVEGTYDISDRLTARGEFLFAHDETPEWKTSPSYPPQALVGLDRIVVPGMPHFDDFLARNPGITTLAGTPLDQGAFVWGRFQGVSGPQQVGSRDYDTWRVKGSLEGELGNGMLWTGSLSYSTSEIEILTNDTRIDNAAWAYRGLGGPDCDPATGTPGSGNAGTGDCWYYNPFTSGFTASQSATWDGTTPPGSENPLLHNPPFMQDWLTEFLGGNSETELLVGDFVISGETDGGVGWAAGAQYRREDFTGDLLPSTNLDEQPCAFGLSAAGETFTIPEIDLGGGNTIPSFTYTCAGTGAFHFLAAGTAEDLDQDIFALFAELSVPFTERLDMQLAVRYEDYGGEVGDTLDPKVAVRWDVTDTVTLRGSITSSFRGPSLNQLSGIDTSLQFVGPAGAFKAIDTFGNSALAPESAITTNFGVIWQPNENWFVSLDYWNFDFDSPIVLENFNDIVTAASDPTSPNFELALSKITFQEDEPVLSQVERIAVTYQNGPDIKTDGVDYQVMWDIPTDEAGLFTLGAQGTWNNSFKVDAWTWADAFDAVGDLNRFESVSRPLPEWKNNFYVNWEMGSHNVRVEAWHVGDYDDKSQPAGADWSIDEHWTFDVHYNFRFNGEDTRIFASVYNFTDEDPPFARLDLAYDPYTHNPFGIMWKVGIQHRFEGGPFR